MNKKGYGCLFPILAIFLFVAGSAAWYHVNIWVANREKIDAMADVAAARHGIDPRLVKAIIWKESRYRVNAVGNAGEIGLMQVYDTAVNEWSNRTGKPAPSRTQLFNPETNIDIGTWYLAWTGRHWTGYKSALLLQISEYNAGYGNVTKYWRPASPNHEVKLEEITIESTRKYVHDVLKRMEAHSRK